MTLLDRAPAGCPPERHRCRLRGDPAGPPTYHTGLVAKFAGGSAKRGTRSRVPILIRHGGSYGSSLPARIPAAGRFSTARAVALGRLRGGRWAAARQRAGRPGGAPWTGRRAGP